MVSLDAQEVGPRKEMIKRIFHKGFSECLKLGIDDLKQTYDFFMTFSTWHLLHPDTQWVGSLAYALVFCFRSSTLGTTSTSSRLAQNPESCALAWWVYGIRETALCALLDVPRRTLIVIGIKSKFRIACEKSVVCCLASRTLRPKAFPCHTLKCHGLCREACQSKRELRGRLLKPCVVLHLYCWH